MRNRSTWRWLVYPYASNLDEFDPLVHEPGVTVVPIRGCERLDAYHAILLPGSKNTVASLRYLRQSGLAAEISRAVQRGVPVLGICGGLQLLGREIHDPHRLESGDCPGLGLLDLTTTLVPDKTTRQRQVPWQGTFLCGYEIHHGQTQAGEGVQAYLPDGLGWCQDNVYGVYVHGLFENARLSPTVSGASGLAWANNGRVVGGCRCQPGAGRPADCRVRLGHLTESTVQPWKLS